MICIGFNLLMRNGNSNAVASYWSWKVIQRKESGCPDCTTIVTTVEVVTVSVWMHPSTCENTFERRQGDAECVSAPHGL